MKLTKDLFNQNNHGIPLIKKFNSDEPTPLFKEGGFPSELGLSLFKDLKATLDVLFESQQIEELNIQQTRMLGAYLSKMVGDAISKEIDMKLHLQNAIKK